MDNTQLAQTPVRNDAEYEAAIDGLLREMEELRVDMEERQQRIETMQAENKALLEQLGQLQMG